MVADLVGRHRLEHLVVEDVRLGPLGWLRWAWRQLTTMKVALYLLLFLGLAAIPGSVLDRKSTRLNSSH